mgnify:CR=1 FL=1
MKINGAVLVSVCLLMWSGCGGGKSSGGNSNPAQPVLSSITVKPPSSTLWVALNNQQFTATGHYSDGTTKDLTTLATWVSSLPGVAMVSPTGVATPVAAGTVTIWANYGMVSGTSTATVVGLAGAYLTPSGPALSLTGSPSSSQLSASAMWTDGKTMDLSSMMNWSSSDATVASVNTNGNVTRGAHAGYATISAMWNSYVLTTAVSVTAQSMSNIDLSGNYVFLLNGVDVSGPAFYTGMFTADGSGNITGQLTATSKDGIIAMPAAFTGTYSVFPDGRGDMTVVLPSPLSTTHLRFALRANGSDGRTILFDPTRATAMMGAFQRQSDAPFSPSSLQGNYVFKLGGADAARKPQTIVGMLNANGGGQVLSGTADWNDNGLVNGGNGRSSPLQVTGSYIVSGDGHGAMTLNVGATQLHFSMFVLSNGLFRLLCTDPGQRLLGQFELQEAPIGGFQTLDGSYTFLLEQGGRAGVFGIGGGVVIGPMSSVGGWATQTGAVVYNDLEIDQATRTVGLDGRAALDLRFYVRQSNIYANYSFAVYMVSPTRMYWIETDTQNEYSGLVQGTGSGQLNGTYIYMAGGLGVASGSEASVLSLLDAATTTNTSGTFNGIVDVNVPMAGAPVVSRMLGSAVANGTFAVDSNSIYVKWVASLAGNQNFTFYINSSGQALMLGETGVGDNPDLDGWMTLQ